MKQPFVIFDMKQHIIGTIAVLTGAIMGCSDAWGQFSAAKRQYVEHLVTTCRPGRVYETGEEATVTVEAYKGGVPLDSVWVRYAVGDELMKPEVTDSVMFSGGKAHISMGTRQEPGFRSCSLSFSVYGEEYSDIVKAGFAPERIRSVITDPEDFDRFWEKAVKEAEAIDLSPEITPLPEKSTDKVEVSRVRLTTGPGGRHIFGYLTRPRDGKKHPVLFCPPGAGANRIRPFTDYSDEGFIYLNINIHDGCDPELDEEGYAAAKALTEGYNRRGIESPETFYYRSVYAACSRCIDFLCSLPDWDGVNVGVTGGSQGGALTLVTAALNNRVTFCAPFYPALCDVTGFLHGRAGGWPKYFRNGPEADGATETVPYYDVVNFARRVTCPVFFSFGFNDNTCPPTSTYAAYNAITAPKTLEVTPTSGHWRYPESNDRCVEWMKQQLH